MRQIVNISLPEETVKMIKAEVKKGGFASVSEFMRHLIRLWNTEKLVRDLKDGEKAFKAGKWKTLTSLKDLE
ncbi:MAG TPA: ribbon-helix-helix domain-containing protein [Candidatus Gracilibacteria bacterium]|nr:ribbon-helix-helix domain-containing protein [Candidatus Gracilibacteria bacterium]